MHVRQRLQILIQQITIKPLLHGKQDRKVLPAVWLGKQGKSALVYCLAVKTHYTDNNTSNSLIIILGESVRVLREQK